MTSKSTDSKLEALRANGSAHPSPESVLDELFSASDFFDRRDLVQVKYEMLRRVRADGWTVAHASSSYGMSRPTYYAAQDSFEREGLPGLVPRKRGPKGGHKLTDEVLAHVRALRDGDPTLGTSQLVDRIRERFAVDIHPRSLERALGKMKKKRS
jgi:transposase